MLDAMRRVTERSPIDAAMNTHGNGDHCFGNELLPAGAEIYATTGAAAELQAAPPQLVNMLKHTDDLGPELAAYIRRIFGPFTFEGIELRLPSTTFEGRLDLTVGDRAVHLIEVGPAHTDGDAIVHVPDAGVVFTGDILFIGGTPIVWAGPFANWLRACDRILALGAAHARPRPRPGHGRLRRARGPALPHLRPRRGEGALRRRDGRRAGRRRHRPRRLRRRGATTERIAVNVETAYREFDPSRPAATRPELFVRMARWASRH